MTRTGSFLAVMLVLSCAPSREKTPEIVRTPAAEPEARAATQDTSAVRTAAMQRLREAMNSFARTAPEPSHQRVLVVLRAVADALEIVPASPRRSAAERVRAAAGKLESSPASSLTHADTAKGALSEVARALIEITPPSQVLVDYQAAVARLDAALREVDVDRPLLQQGERLLLAFWAATDALSLLAGEPPRHQDAAGSSRAAGGDDDSFVTDVAEARSSVQELARAEGADARVVGGETLDRFADAVRSASRGGRGVDRDVANIRFQAQRLRGTDSMAFDQARWIKRGLAATLDGLQAAKLTKPASLEPWVRAARQSIQSIDDQGALTFQRAAIQDAFRAVSDVLMVAANEPRCE